MTKISAVQPSILLRATVSVMLLLALVSFPYGYYILLRWITCGVGLYSASIAYNQSKKGWAIGLAVIALIFNPLLPIHLDRETWAFVDILAAVLFIFSVGYVREMLPVEPEVNSSIENAEVYKGSQPHQESVETIAISPVEMCSLTSEECDYYDSKEDACDYGKEGEEVWKNNSCPKEGEQKNVQYPSDLPDDAFMVKEVESWTFYFSESQNSFYLDTSDYHPKPLQISRDMIKDFETFLK
jgi:hypothetical protein